MPNKVLLKKSSVAAKVPLVTDLDYGELALNYTDEKLYFKNASNAIKSFTAPNNGTLTLNVSGTGLSGSASFTADQSTATTFTVTSNATNANTASTIVARDASGNFSAGTITATLSGNATNVTGTVAIANGGTGATTAQAAINALAAATTSGQYLRGNGTNVVMSAIQAGDVPTLNQNTTGTAANVTGTVAIANGGTGATTNTAARTNLGATTLGANLFTITNPSAITFPRFNADNTVSALDAATFRTAIGAGTSSTTGTVTSVGGTGTVSGLSLSGTVTTSGNLTLSGTLSVTPSNFASQTANTFLAAPNGSAGTPTFRALVAADVPTLNQNTTGTASNVTGTVAIANGGTGATTAQAAINALAAATTSGQYLRGNGTNVVMSAIQAADVPTLNQNTTGTASNVTGTVAIANGGTGATTNTAARTNLGATTVGANLFTLTNPSAITFLRVNADNTVSTLDAATFRTAIGAGTSSTTGTVTSVGGTGTVSGLTLSGTVTTSGNLTLGGTLAVTPSNFASQTANTVLAAPNGAAGVPTFRALVAADIPTLNQNTTGTASNVTGTVAIANGGTGATSQQAAVNAIAGAVTSGQYLRGNGTNVVMSAIQAADVPTLNQNTTGTASNVTGTVAIANGGTGTTTAQAAINALAAATTSGQYLRGNGTNVVMSAIQAGDVPTLNQNTTGSAATLTTTRTLWGQNFNGSANVSGALTSVGNITGTGAVTLTATAGTLALAATGANIVTISTNSTEHFRVSGTGNVGIGGVTNPGYKLEVNGSFAATSKSFLIPHPTKPNMKLRHGSLEGPEHGVYIRGKIKGKVIELPEYWTKLVDPDSITVQLTAIGKGQKLYVEDIRDNKVYIANDGLFAGEPYCFYFIQAERVDIEKMQVEIE